MKNSRIIASIILSILFLSSCGKSGEEYFQLGIDKYNAGYYKDGITYFNKSLKLEPENVKARFYLGMCYKKSGDIENALAEIRYANEINPNDFYIMYNLADCCNALGQFDKAAIWARRSLAVKHDFMDSHLLLGISLYRLGQPDEAVKEFEFLTKLTQNDTKNSHIYEDALFYLGTLYRQKGDLKASLEAILKLNELNPQSESYIYSLGLTYHAMNNIKETQAQLRKLENINSTLAQKLKDKIK